MLPHEYLLQQANSALLLDDVATALFLAERAVVASANGAPARLVLATCQRRAGNVRAAHHTLVFFFLQETVTETHKPKNTQRQRSWPVAPPAR